MAVKDMIARGIGFSPGSVAFIVTGGLGTVTIPESGGAGTLSSLSLTSSSMKTLSLITSKVTDISLSK